MVGWLDRERGSKIFVRKTALRPDVGVDAVVDPLVGPGAGAAYRRACRRWAFSFNSAAIA